MGASLMEDVFVSVVVPVDDTISDVERCVGNIVRLGDALASRYLGFEIVIVESNRRVLSNESKWPDSRLPPYVRALQILDEGNGDVLTLAGLDSVIGDYIVVIDLEIDAPGIVAEMVSASRDRRAELIVARYSVSKWWCAYRVGRLVLRVAFFALTGRSLKVGFSSTVCLSRSIVNVLVSDRRRAWNIRLLVNSLAPEDFFVPETAERGSRSLRKAVHRAVRLLSSAISSATQLRAISFLGQFSVAVYFLYVVTIYLLRPSVAEGWTTTSLLLSGVSLLIFRMFGLVSRQLDSVHGDAMDRPAYIVKSETLGAAYVLNDAVNNISHRED